MIAYPGVRSDKAHPESGCRRFIDRNPFYSQFDQIIQEIIVGVDYGIHSDLMGMNTLFDSVVVIILTTTAAEFFIGSPVCDFRTAFKAVDDILFFVIFHRFFFDKNAYGRRVSQ